MPRKEKKSRKRRKRSRQPRSPQESPAHKNIQHVQQVQMQPAIPVPMQPAMPVPMQQRHPQQQMYPQQQMQGGMQMAKRGQRWPKLYSYKYYFCCGCQTQVCPPRAIQSFFYSQNVTDILFNLGCWAILLRPPASGAGAIMWVVFLLLSAMAISTVVGFVVSCQARSDLKKLIQNGPGSASNKKTKLAILMMTIALGITTFFYVFFTMFCFYYGLFATSSGNAVGSVLGGLLLIIGFMLLPFTLLWVSQLCQCLKMKKAADDCGSVVF